MAGKKLKVAIFSATGITDGQLLTGIKDHGNFFEAETFILHYNSKTNKKNHTLIKSNIDNS